MGSHIDDDAILPHEGGDALTRPFASQEPLLEPERTRVEVGDHPSTTSRSLT